MANIIDGKFISKQIRCEMQERIKNHFIKTGRRPGLAVVIVGENPASQVYVRNKKKACEDIGIYSEVIALPNETDMNTLRTVIEKLNSDENINGILVQLPLPRHLDESEVIMMIAPEKDVDAFHPLNVGGIMTGNYSFVPCTPAGVMQLLIRSGVQIEGKNCVVIGRSNIVGKPMAMLLLEANGTVTICHSKTKNLSEICKSADIIIAAVGRPHFVTADMVKDGAIVIDVGINRLDDGKLVGDVDFESVEKKVSYITPVPGGVGPMTITMLLQNTLTAAGVK